MIEQVPAVTTFIAPFTTVQTVGVVEVKVTGYEMPALLVASKVCGVLTVVIAIGAIKPISIVTLSPGITISILSPSDINSKI